MLTLPGLTTPSDKALRAAVRRIAGLPGSIVMIGPVVRRAVALTAMLDHPRDLYLCHDFGPDDGESWLIPWPGGAPWRRGSPMALGEALRASGYPMSRLSWSREAMTPAGVVAMVVAGRRITLAATATTRVSFPEWWARMAGMV